jgi:hypothetical protein
VPIVTPAGSKQLAQRFYYCEKSCIAILLYIGLYHAKAKKPIVKNDLDRSQNKTLNIAG